MSKNEGWLEKTESKSQSHSSRVKTSENRVSRRGHTYSCHKYTRGMYQSTKTGRQIEAIEQKHVTLGVLFRLPARRCHSPPGAAAVRCRDEPEHSPPCTGYSKVGWESTQTNADTNLLYTQKTTLRHNRSQIFLLLLSSGTYESSQHFEAEQWVVLEKLDKWKSYQRKVLHLSKDACPVS